MKQRLQRELLYPAVMKRVARLLCVIVLGLGAYCQATQCTVPPDIQPLLSQKWKAWRLLQLSDLRADDQKLWRQYYRKVCPGMTTGRFLPGEPVAHAFMLINKSEEALLVAVTDKNPVKLITVLGGSSVAYFSIVRTVHAGAYTDFYTRKKIVTKLDSVAVEAIEHSTEIFYWSNGRFLSLLISD
jgi:hypothetical protein